MTSKKMHSAAIVGRYGVSYKTAPILSLAMWIDAALAKASVTDADILYIVPSSRRYIPEIGERRTRQHYRCAINNGDSVRYKAGTLRLLLGWLVDECSKGNVGETDDVFISVKRGRLPWEK